MGYYFSIWLWPSDNLKLESISATPQPIGSQRRGLLRAFRRCTQPLAKRGCADFDSVLVHNFNSRLSVVHGLAQGFDCLSVPAV